MIDVKFSGIVETPFLYHYWKFQTCILLPVDFMDLQMSKIVCELCMFFQIQSHTYIGTFIDEVSEHTNWHVRNVQL